MTNIIVADSIPLIIAARTDLLRHFPQLLGRVFIPRTVAEECAAPSKPGSDEIRKAIADGLLSVSEAARHEFLSRIPDGIDAGEAEAIALALNLKAKLLIDDRKGRKVAKQEGLQIFGFGAVLVKAKREGVVDSVRPIIRRMNEMGYRISDKVVAEILALCEER